MRPHRREPWPGLAGARHRLAAFCRCPNVMWRVRWLTTVKYVSVSLVEPPTGICLDRACPGVACAFRLRNRRRLHDTPGIGRRGGVAFRDTAGIFEPGRPCP